MKISKVAEILEAEVVACRDFSEHEVCSACGSDMMSDVLAFVKDQAVLLTGLVNSQVIRTAEMMDMRCVVFVRGKRPGSDVLALAQDSGIAILATDMRMYPACGILYQNGLHAGECSQ